MMTTLYNFGSGPSTIPESVLTEIQSELKDWQGLGVSLLEVGHRTPEYIQLMEDMEADFRTLAKIPSQYHVLFLGSAARTQFAMIPMNLLDVGEQAAYIISGLWSSLAYEEACKLKEAYCVARLEAPYQTPLNDISTQLKNGTAYLYYTPNETISGVRFPEPPVSQRCPLVADMTSCLLAEPLDIKSFGLIFAGAQKNLGAVGLTVVIVHDELLQKSPSTPLATMLDYRVHAQHHSMYATPPMFSCYVASKMIKWMLAQGGLEHLYAQNCQKSRLLYDCIDTLPLYQCDIAPISRSRINVCFSLTRSDLNDKFLSCAKEQGLYALKGHRLSGGIRASLYNAMPVDGVNALIEFMEEFAEQYG